VKFILTRLAVVCFGLILPILMIELALWLIPNASWKSLISKSPPRFILYRSDRDIGWVPIPNAEINWQGYGEFDVNVKMNSLGLRDRERATYEKSPGTFRILILGDSFTEGIQVPLEQLFSIRLETCLNEQVSPTIEVINGGVSGYSTGDELLFFLKEGVKYQPDLVLVAIFAANDTVKEMGREFDDNMIQSLGGFQFYLDSQGHLQKRWLEWADPDHEISWPERLLRRYSSIYYILRAPDSTVRGEVNETIDDWWPESPSPESVLAKSNDEPDYRDDENLIIFAEGFPDNPDVPPQIKAWWRLFETIVLELQKQVALHDAQLAAVIIPRDAQIHPELYQIHVNEFIKRYGTLGDTVWDLAAPDKAILEFMNKHTIPTLDLMPGFQAYAQTHDDLLYFEQDIHFTQQGHRLAAGLMCDWLIEDGLVPR